MIQGIFTVVLLFVVSAITHVTQLELYDQQRAVLQSGRGSHSSPPSRTPHPPHATPCHEESATTSHPPPSNVQSSFIKSSTLYMDELFHVPQVLRFGVLGNWSYYDPMLTTPPGSYLPLVAALHLMKWPLPSPARVTNSGPTTGFSVVPSPNDRETSHAGVAAAAAAVGVGEEVQISNAWRSSFCAAEAFDIVSVQDVTCGLGHAAAARIADSPLGNALLRAAGLDIFPSKSYAELVHTLRRWSSMQHTYTWAIIAVIVTIAGPKLFPGVTPWHTMAVALFPPLLFSSVLVYTDVMSALCVALMVLFMPKASFSSMVFLSREWLRVWVVAFIGLYSITVRQTNIVWVFFVSARFGLNVLVLSTIGGKGGHARWARLIMKLVTFLLPCVATAIAFVAFVVWNGAIVLGDKSSHPAVFHPAQLVYLFCTLALFYPLQCGSALWTSMKNGLGVIRGYWRGDRAVSLKSVAVEILGELAVISAMGAALAPSLVRFHPYLMADNRHYTNVWYRLVLRRTPVRYLFCIPFGVAGWHFFKSSVFASSRQRWIDMPLILFCASISCVPQGLIELRYFVPVIVVLFLAFVEQQSPRRLAPLMGDCIFLIVVHAVTCYVFVHSTFVAPDGSVGRFMW